ncbi:hypothetical protein NL676_007186 [Syzygium grande]|nr:hypothetical protein NL676_007186 [Syzygium grande]
MRNQSFGFGEYGRMAENLKELTEEAPPVEHKQFVPTGNLQSNIVRIGGLGSFLILWVVVRGVLSWWAVVQLNYDSERDFGL